MKKITFLIIVFLSVFAFNNCSEDIAGTEDLNYVTFETTTIDMGVDIGSTAEYDVQIFTTSKMSSDRTFNIKVVTETTTADAATYSVPATVTVPANTTTGILKVSLTDVNIGDGKILVLDIESQDGLYKGKAVTINIAQICPYNEVLLNIIFDDWASECSWEILNSSDEVIASGGSYEDGDVSASAKFCLQDGTYTFNVYDAWGDGLSSPGGSVTLISNGVELVYVEDDYGDGISETFTLPN